MANIFYVYLHRRADDGRVFYVGKGQGKRAWAKRRENEHWLRTVSKHGFTVEIIEKDLPEWKAFEFEVALIAFFGRENLTNMTDGGEGVANPSAETRAAMASRRADYFKNNSAARQTQSERMKEFFSDPEQRKAASERSKATQGTDAARAANSARQKARYSDPALCQTMSEKIKKIQGTPEARKINSERQSTPAAKLAASEKMKLLHKTNPRSADFQKAHSEKMIMWWKNKREAVP